MKTRLLGVPSRVSPDLTSSESLRRSTASAGSIRLQPKLSVNQPGDKFEQEADRIAEQVMRMPAPSMQSDGPHRDVGTCREGLQPASRLEPGGRILRTANDSTAGIDAPQIVNSVVASSGMPLPTESRRFME